MADWHAVEGGVTAPRGYRAAGISAGLKPSGALDLALILSEVEAIAAGVFTKNQVRAACVDYCQQQLSGKAFARAILCNSGQANAGTGQQGWEDAIASANALGNILEVDPDQILLTSTGVIGQRIPIDVLLAGLPALVEQAFVQGSNQAEQAILTTDLVTKSIALEGSLNGRPVRIGGMSKGSGMIHPNMATMLAFVTCDASISPHLWQAMLRRAADLSFNQITVDGDTSTNDTLLALANGQSRTPAITEMGPEAELLEAMLTEVCIHLAKAIARDGEGATCLIEVEVAGAPDDNAARTIARTIAGSSLVKSAVFGRDPNWGRIASAAGQAGIPFQQNQLQIQLGDILLMEKGQPLPFDRDASSHYLQQKSAPDDPTAALDRHAIQAQSIQDPVRIQVRIGEGLGQGRAWGCDLSYDYVRINAEYTT